MEREPPTPAAHQPSKSELEDDVSIDTTPESLAWAVTRGGAERCQDNALTKSLDRLLTVHLC